MNTSVLLIYISTGGNTKKLARLPAEQLPEWAEVECCSLDKAERNPEMVRRADIVGLGSPVFHLRMLPPMPVLARGRHCGRRHAHCGAAEN